MMGDAAFGRAFGGHVAFEKTAQGYAYVADESGHCLSSIKGVAIGDPVQVYVRDGRCRLS